MAKNKEKNDEDTAYSVVVGDIAGVVLADCIAGIDTLAGGLAAIDSISAGRNGRGGVLGID